MSPSSRVFLRLLHLFSRMVTVPSRLSTIATAHRIFARISSRRTDEKTHPGIFECHRFCSTLLISFDRSFFRRALHAVRLYRRPQAPRFEKDIFWNLNRCIDLKRASFFHLFVYPVYLGHRSTVRVLVRVSGTLGGVRCSQVD